jgi:hypothetical protein
MQLILPTRTGEPALALCAHRRRELKMFGPYGQGLGVLVHGPWTVRRAASRLRARAGRQAVTNHGRHDQCSS